MKKYFLLSLAFAMLLLLACGSKKKKSMSGNEDVAFTEFVDFYPELKMPFIYADSLFPKTENDSMLISPEIYQKFIPDSLMVSTFGKAAPKLYAVGKILNGEEETYLITRGGIKDKRFVFIDALGKDNKYIAGLPLFKFDNTGKWLHHVTIDDRFNITKNTTYKERDGSTINGVDVYILNNAARKFMLVMTDSLGDGVSELMNPIDTLGKKQKFTGDYGLGKNTLISFRDGSRAGRLNFFIYIEDPAKDCMGELKGEIIFKDEKNAVYRQGSDPCALEFVFDKNIVTIKEIEGCGSRLGNINCKFDGVYPLKGTAKIIERKKAEIKKVQAKKSADSTSNEIKPEAEKPVETPPATIDKNAEPAKKKEPAAKETPVAEPLKAEKP